jgi:hypothetical protein
VKQNSAAAASSRLAEKLHPFCEIADVCSSLSHASLWSLTPRRSMTKLVYAPRGGALSSMFGVGRSAFGVSWMSLRQHCLVKLVPIVEIVQVHRVFECRSIIRNLACAEDPLARFVVVIVAAHRGVVFLHGIPI